MTCVFSNLDDCGEVAEHFIKPHMMTWIMSAQALGCTPFNIMDVTFGFDTGIIMAMLLKLPCKT